MSAWYWYLTGIITTLCFISAIVNLLIITGALKIQSRRQVREKIHLIYNWADDSGPISRVG